MQFLSRSRERGWGVFPDGWPGEVLHYVLNVWKKFRLPSSVRLEPRVTKLLVGAIRKQYESEGRDWFVTVEDPEWDESGKEISRTDIRFYPPGKQRHAVSFVFECKCLNKPQSNASKYVGADGMMCFINGKYGAGLPCAGMLGFVMDGDVPRAHRAVCKAIGKRQNSLQIVGQGDYRSSSVLNNHRWHGETIHQVSGSRFTIYHLLLRVRQKPSSDKIGNRSVQERIWGLLFAGSIFPFERSRRHNSPPPLLAIHSLRATDRQKFSKVPIAFSAGLTLG